MSTLLSVPTTSGGRVMSNSIVAPISSLEFAWMYTPAALTFLVVAFSPRADFLVLIVIGSVKGNRLPVRLASDTEIQNLVGIVVSAGNATALYHEQRAP